VTTASGEVCGELQQIDTSGITLNADGQNVSFAFGEIVSLQSVTAC